ncbi:MAG TPA: hypothetical protein VG204_00575 [Terriglobia bacterium]|nr:hypothetical protein [Terriglobia bacterium]
MNNNFEPWTKYPDLTLDRLSALANIIRSVWHDTTQLHDTAGGDTNWSLGCRVYVRTCHAIREASKTRPWLTILPELERLRFSFAVGSVPFRFFRGNADEPPERYLIITPGELHHRQLSLEGMRRFDSVLRLAVEVDRATREVLSVNLVEMDDAGNITDTYAIPFVIAPADVTPMQVKPVDLAAPIVEPLKTPEQEKQKEKKPGEVGKAR